MSVSPGGGKEIEQLFSKEGRADRERTKGHQASGMNVG